MTIKDVKTLTLLTRLVNRSPQNLCEWLKKGCWFVKCEDDGGGAERSVGEEGTCEVQRRWHHRRPEEACGGSDWYEGRQD